MLLQLHLGLVVLLHVLQLALLECANVTRSNTSEERLEHLPPAVIHKNINSNEP